MTNSVLYFPYINLPENSWTIKSILYWDTVGVIVPPSYIETPHNYEQYTGNLLQSNLVTQIFPNDYINNSEFDQGFINLLENDGFNISEKQQNFEHELVTKVNVMKFGEKLMKKLVELRIATKINHQWYLVEYSTANLIMLYLASYIGIKEDFTPSTDKLLDYPSNLTSQNTINKNQIREKLLEDIIPYPVNPNLDRLKRFKDLYYDELNSFRILLERTISEINNNQDEEFYSIKVEELIDKRDKISSDLKGFKFSLAKFSSIIGLGGATYGAISGNDIATGIGLVQSVLSLAQAFNKPDILSQECSYLALIDKNFN
ncbi:hypothetical protein SAMN05421841_4154 [Chryseobacterium wanjuense]|uniref:Uncharacterized protein n=1 Tax=Chryseobacterium wanjuense TaxID=356305 RepID=A0A1I0S5P7_9FLAO|nr:hypothetical protein [Chryseobacterium wanjuense]SEW49379.1 hypothetical protein SAMN05421841_4154 [Chryseobacterium wanjuense]